MPAQSKGPLRVSPPEIFFGARCSSLPLRACQAGRWRRRCALSWSPKPPGQLRRARTGAPLRVTSTSACRT